MEHIVLARYPQIDYVLVKRTSEKAYQPYVAAWCYNEERKSWGQGHYFCTEEDAREYIQYKYEERFGERLGKQTMEIDEREVA